MKNTDKQNDDLKLQDGDSPKSDLRHALAAPLGYPRPRLLDLFCGVGGAAVGYYDAGFDVTGVDIKFQPQYPFWFFNADALDYLAAHGHEYDVIHASPPCQAHSALRHLHPQLEYECYISRVRDILGKIGKPYVIENVPGAPLRNPITLCGSSFGLAVRRHRLFESNIPLRSLPCDHKTQGQPIDVSGTGGRRINRRQGDHGGSCNKPRNIDEARSAIKIEWAGRYGISQAIPPAYTEYIGKQLLIAIRG